MIQAETLELLEWSRLCHHLATFASTKLGVVAARNLPIPHLIAESQSLLAQTQEAYRLESDLPTGLVFDGIQDIGESLERAERRGILSGYALLDIATTLAGSRQLRRVIDSQEDLPVLTELVSDLRTYPELEQEIHRCIDDRGRVTDRANPKLESIREQIRQVHGRIYEALQRLIQRHSNAIQETVITQRGDRFVIPVKATHKDAIPGIVHDASSSGATLYIEPSSIVNLGNQFRQLLRQEQREEEEVRRKLTEQIAEVQPDLERLLAIVTTLDLATARARYSLWLEANPPRFIHFGLPFSSSPSSSNETSSNNEMAASSPEPIVLRQLRHPLLVWQQQHEQGTAVVPIDLVIQPHIRVVAITGPNTGGKTVTLKTLGLAVLMAKVGLFVPAREPVELPWFDQVLADIGDEQSLQQSLSTFSGHIRRISRILEAIGQPDAELESKNQPSLEAGDDAVQREADLETNFDVDLDSEASLSRDHPATHHTPPASLILLDEVGAGTDPSEGSALAIALLNHLADHATLTIATTHFGELKALKYQDARFENASVEFDDVSLAPTYRLLWGIPGRSNALTIARRLGLKDSIVEAARQQVGASASAEVNEMIAGLETQRKQQEQRAAAAADLVRQAEQLHQEVARKADLLKERERDLKQQQEQAVQAAIVQAKAEIAKVIRKLQQGSPTAQEAQQATDALSQIAAQCLPSRQHPPKPKPGFRPQVGDRVRIPRLGQTAEVITQPDEDGELTVRFGLMKMTVSLADVESLQGEKADLPEKRQSKAAELKSIGSKEKDREKSDREATPSAPNVRTSRNTIDLRGSRVTDAEVVLEQMIARAEPGPLWIIHGHGTGKLKRGVQEFLKRHPQIQRHEFAEQADGGSGVTVAYVQ